MANLGTLTAHIGADTTGLRSGLAQSQAQISRFSTGAMRSFAKLSGAFAALGVAVGGIAIFKNITKIGIDFEQTMTTVAGVMRATAEESKALTAAARKMGETTEWSASEAGGALQFLGMAGFEANKAIKALPGTLDLATAGQIGLGRAADIATNALTAMGLEVEELERVNDVFVGTITRSNTNMEMMAESFKYAAPVARAFGYSIEELSGLIGMLGNAGIQGSMAGTQLAMAMQKTNEVAEDFGLKGGKFVDVLEQARAKGYSATEVMKAFGLRAGRAAGVLFEATDATREFQATLADVDGEAKRLADTMRSTVGASFKELKSVIESLAIDIFETYRDELKGFVGDTTAWIRENKDKILGFVEGVKTFLGGMMEVVSSVASLLGKLGLGFTDFFKTVESNAIDTANSVAESGEKIRKALAPPKLTPWQEFWAFMDEVGRGMISIAEFAVRSIGNLLAGLLKFVVSDIIGNLILAFWDLSNVMVTAFTLDLSGVEKWTRQYLSHMKTMWTEAGETGQAMIGAFGNAWNDMVKDLRGPPPEAFGPSPETLREYFKRLAAEHDKFIREYQLPPPLPPPPGGVGGIEAMAVPTETLAEYLDSVNEWVAKYKRIQQNRYDWLYEHEQISAEEYLAFLEWKLEKFTEYEDDWMTIQQRIEEVQATGAEDAIALFKKQYATMVRIYEALGSAAGNVFTDIFTKNQSLVKSLGQAWEWFRQQVFRILGELLARWITTKLIMASISGPLAFLFEKGGEVKGMQVGGLISGLRASRDTVLAMLTPGEFVMPEPRVRQIGVPALEYMRKTGEIPAGGDIHIDMGGFTFYGMKKADAYLTEAFITDRVSEAVKEALKTRELEL